MDPGEPQTAREYLGLTTEALAGMLDVRHDTLRRWESGRDPIPLRVREEVERIEGYTAAAVGEVIDALMDSRAAAVRVYRTDADMHTARPDLAHLPARWWRHVVARAAHEVPGVEILSETPVAEADLKRVASAARALVPGADVRTVTWRLLCDACHEVHPMAVALSPNLDAGAAAPETAWCPRVQQIRQGDHVPGSD